MTRGQCDHLFRLLFFRMDRQRQFVESAGWRNQKAFHCLIGLVEDAVRNIHRHPDEVARRADILAVENEIKTSLEKVDELVLRWMDMRRTNVPGEVCARKTNFRSTISGHKSVPEYSRHAFDAGTGLGDACGQRLHSSSPIIGFDAAAEASADAALCCSSMTASVFLLSKASQERCFRFKVLLV